jgi:E3 ubiquitin-protein ligase HUWE1
LTYVPRLSPPVTTPQAFLEGFWQLVPRELICIFNDHELELLISGLPDIDVGDLRANTEYTGFSPNSPVIQWFWQVVADMDKQDLALLLQFVTGEEATALAASVLALL